MLKFTGISFVVMFTSLIGFGVTTDSSETKSDDNKQLENVAKINNETPEEKAAREVKEAEEAEVKAKAEAEAKLKAEEEAKLAAEVKAQEKATFRQTAITNSKEITYPMLDKAAERYSGKPYYIKGEVAQAMEDGNYTILRIDMTQTSWGWWEDTVWVEYAGITDAVEGSLVDLYGKINGTHTYDTAIGGQMSLPAIIAEELNVLQ